MEKGALLSVSQRSQLRDLFSSMPLRIEKPEKAGKALNLNIATTLSGAFATLPLSKAPQAGVGYKRIESKWKTKKAGQHLFRSCARSYLRI